MGNSNSEEGRIGSKANNQYAKYIAQLKADQISAIEPFYNKELSYLQELFGNLDKKNLKSLELKDFDDIVRLKNHPFYFRMKELFEEQMKKIKAKRINFELFLFLLSIFHVDTEAQLKLKYIFRIYDCDKNLKIESNDLFRMYKMTYAMPFLTEQDYSKLVTETLIKYGSNGEIKFENLMEMIPLDEVKEALSFKFDSTFS